MAKINFNTQGAIRIATRSVREGIEDIMQEVLDQAVADAPVDTTALRESGHINYNAKSISIIFDTKYAAVQHEDLSFNHPRGGKAKYLEDAFHDIVPGATRRLHDKVNDDLRDS